MSKKASKQASNQSNDICVRFLRLISHSSIRIHSFQHLKVTAIFLSGPDAIHFFSPPRSQFFHSLSTAFVDVLSCACHFNSFTCLFAHSPSLFCYLCLSVWHTYFLRLPACPSVYLHVFFNIFLPRTLCGARDMHYSFVSQP